MNWIYLDHNATTPLDPLVADEMASVLRSTTGNPASQHELGRRARRLLEDARDAIAGLLDIGADARIVFTSGGTEANNWILRGLLNPGDICITSSIEHPSISETTQHLEHDRQIRVLRLPVRADGVTDPSALDDWLPGAKIVSVMLANNETGVLQPIDAIVQQCRSYNIPVHTDAVQAIGKIPLSFQRLGVSAMTIAAHKFHGPVGIGALVLKKYLRIRPLLYGGFQQSGLRPGTESVALAVGMCKALQLWHREAAIREQRLRLLRDRFESLLISALPMAEVIGKSAARVPHTSNIAFPGIDRQALVMALDLRGIGCSTGSACASGSSDPSPVLEAMQLPPVLVQGAVRFSLGAFTTSDEIQTAAEQVITCVRLFHAAAPVQR